MFVLVHCRHRQVVQNRIDAANLQSGFTKLRAAGVAKLKGLFPKLLIAALFVAINGIPQRIFPLLLMFLTLYDAFDEAQGKK